MAASRGTVAVAGRRERAVLSGLFPCSLSMVSIKDWMLLREEVVRMAPGAGQSRLVTAQGIPACWTPG